LCHIEKFEKKTLQSTRKIVPLKILVTIGLETCHPPGCAPRRMDGKLQFPSEEWWLAQLLFALHTYWQPGLWTCMSIWQLDMVQSPGPVYSGRKWSRRRK